VGEAVPQGTTAAFTDHFPVTGDTLTLWVTVTLKEDTDLTHRIGIRCNEIITDKGRLRLPTATGSLCGQGWPCGSTDRTGFIPPGHTRDWPLRKNEVR